LAVVSVGRPVQAECSARRASPESTTLETPAIGHLDRFIIHRIALDLFPVTAQLRFAVLDEFIQPLDLDLEAAFALLLTFDLDLRMLICLRVFFHYALEFLLQLITLVFEFSKGAAPFLGDVGGEFDAIERKVRAAQ
jgi:hypothetical protein